MLAFFWADVAYWHVAAFAATHHLGRDWTNRWGNRPAACGWLKILGAALQADGENEVTEVTGLKHQKEKREPWTILLDWTYRSGRPASALWMTRAESYEK
jgi:hypothetical protein